jgi:hypothetical protein
MFLINFGFFGLLAATIVAILLVQLAKRRFKENPARYRTVRPGLTIAPFAALLWVALAFVLHVQISHRMAHQDCGLGMSPDPFVTLPNGYELGGHNTYDGYLLAPGFKSDVPIWGPGYVRSIVTLRFDGDIASGTQFDFKTSRTRPFIFNMKTREFKTDAPENKDHPCDSNDPSCLKVWTVANDQADRRRIILASVSRTPP